MSVVIGTLTIDLAANTASFSGAMDKASNLAAKSANDIKRSLEKITAAGIAMASAIAAGTTAAIKGALDAADELGKMAQSAGTTAETLSTLEYAAKLSNVENETLVKGLEKLSLAAFKAQGGNVQLERIFARVGVTVRDSNGALKDSGVLMEQLAVKFAKMGDSAGKTALAQAIFGKSGAQLIPFLNQYGSEQEKINDEAHRFGLVLSTSTVEVAAHAHDSLEKLSSIMKGLGFSLLSATLPALDELLNKLIAISQNADMQGLARSFGGEVVKAVHALGDALDFAANHAKALKIALEAIAGLALAKIAIPVIGDLAAGGWEKAASGIGKFLIGITGLGRVIPVLAQFGGWLKYTASFVGMLAAEEGLASAASYVLGGAVAAMGGPIGIAVAAITGLTLALYHFRDATFTVRGQTYELRDVWSAAWIEMKDDLRPVGAFFSDMVAGIKKLWSELVGWITQNTLAQRIVGDLKQATDWVKGHLPSLLDDVDVNALSRAKALREGAAAKPSAASAATSPTTPKLPPPNTEGLGKPQKDVFGDEIRKLDLAIEAQQKYLSVLGGTPEVIQAATAAEKAHAVIVELNNRLIDEGRARLTARQQAMIEERVATEESLRALLEYGKEVVNQQHAADLSIQQAQAMAIAQTQGDEAVRRATVDNAILALSYNKTAEQLARMAPELVKLRGLLTSKGNADLLESANRDIFALRQEAGAQDILRSAILGTIEAQRGAEIQAKTYALSQQIAAASDDTARMALMEKRDAIEQEMRAQQQAADLAEARRTLGGPFDEYQRDAENLQNLVAALQNAQGGYLTYSQEISAASAQQEIFDKAVDRTVQEMLRFGDARDGVDAFFLDMQRQAQSTASIIYEALHSAFDKISDNLAELVTGGKTSFAKMFQDIGKQIVQSEIKQQLQKGVATLGAKLGIDLNGILGKASKIDGSTAAAALWVRMASADGFGQSRTTNELTGLIGPNAPQEPGDQSTRSIGSVIASLFGKKQKSPFGESLGMPEGNELADLLGSSSTPASENGGFPAGNELADLFASSGGSQGGFDGDESAMDLPTDEGIGEDESSGVLSTLTSVLGGLKSGMQSQGAPKGTASNPLYVKAAGGDQSAGTLPSLLASLFGKKQKSPFGESLGMPEDNELADLLRSNASPAGESVGFPTGNELADLFASSGGGQGGFGGDESAMDLPTDEGVGEDESTGALSTLASVLGGLKSGMQSQGAPKGTASNPLYVKAAGGDQSSGTLPSLLASLIGKTQKSPFGESLGMPEGNELADLLRSSSKPGGESIGFPTGNELADLFSSSGAGQGGFGGDETAMDLPTDEGVGDDEGSGVLSTLTSVLGGLKSGMQSQGTPKGTASNPLYVKMVGGSGGSPLGGLGGLGGILGGGGGGGFGGDESIMDQPTDEGLGGGFFSGLLSKLSGLFGGGSGGSGGLSSIFGMLGGLIPHAEGGPVSPSSAYLVGEQGPEILTGVSGSITSNTNSMRALSGSGGPSVSYSIDARGTDPAQTEQRVQRAIRAAHNSAINTAVQASAERMKRVPHRY